jgi:hypothetical protein
MLKLSRIILFLLCFVKPDMGIYDYEWDEAYIKHGQFIQIQKATGCHRLDLLFLNAGFSPDCSSQTNESRCPAVTVELNFDDFLSFRCLHAH